MLGCMILFIKQVYNVNNASQVYLINDIITIIPMLFCIRGWVLVCFEYPNTVGYIVYLWYCIDFDFISVILKLSISA